MAYHSLAGMHPVYSLFYKKKSFLKHCKIYVSFPKKTKKTLEFNYVKKRYINSIFLKIYKFVFG